MLELRQGHDLAVLLKVAQLSRSTFYYQAKVQQAGDRQADLKSRIRTLYERHKGRYGYRRITAALRQADEVVNHKTVQRLMQALGLKSLARPKKYRSYRGQQASVPNVLARQFRANRPNQKWVTDVTELNVRGEKLYLSPVMDLYNGEIVSYAMQKRPLFAGGEHAQQGISQALGQRCAALALRPRLAVPDARLPAAACRTRPDPKHVAQR